MATVATCQGPHCSVCCKGARFLVQRAGNKEPLCTEHFDWLIENTSKDQKFERCRHTCTCNWDAIGKARKAMNPEKSAKPPEEAAPPAPTKKCKCGCGTDISAGSSWSYVRGHAPRPGQTPSAKPAKGAVIVRERPAEPGSAVERSVPAIQTSGSAAVTVSLSESAMTRWWTRLSVQDKATVFMTCFGE